MKTTLLLMSLLLTAPLLAPPAMAAAAPEPTVDVALCGPSGVRRCWDLAVQLAECAIFNDCGPDPAP